jgi:hypothetical protein
VAQVRQAELRLRAAGAALGVLEQAMRAALASAGARLLEAVLAGQDGYCGPRAATDAEAAAIGERRIVPPPPASRSRHALRGDRRDRRARPAQRDCRAGKGEDGKAGTREVKLVRLFTGAGLPLRCRQCAAGGLPGSGTPDELMEAAGISASRVAAAARELLKEMRDGC